MIQVLSRSEPSITASFSGKANFMRVEAMQQVGAVPARPSVDEIGVGEILLGRRETDSEGQCPQSFKEKRIKKAPAQMGRGFELRFVVNQPQVPELQDPELQPPPPPTGLVEVMEKPERYPASRKSTLMAPQEESNPSSTRKLTPSS